MATRSVTPVSRPVAGVVRPPGSKSLTNRALAVAALADSRTTIESAGVNDDTRVMAEALRVLGIEVEIDEPARTPRGRQASRPVEPAGDAGRIRVAGCGGQVPEGPRDLNTGDSGTATRFLTALVAAGRGRYRIDGSERMRERPIQDLLDALEALGVEARSDAGTGCPPVTIRTDGLRGGDIEVRGATSSQFLSGLLMAAPAAGAPVTIRVAGELVSKPFVDMTLVVMRDFGVGVGREGYARFEVAAPRAYRGRRYAVEPDASSASYFLAAAAVTGGRVTVEGLSRDSIQGDVRFADVLGEMGCSVEWSDRGVTVAGPERLHGIRIDMNAMPDMVPTLAPLALLAKGRTVIENVANLRVKESDRLSALATELRRLGARVEEHPDGLTVYPPQAVLSGEVATYDDHRMAMGFAVVGLKVPGILLAGAECVSKTYPEFFEDLQSLVG